MPYQGAWHQEERRKVSKVKHISRLSKEMPPRANEFQFIICEFSRAMGDLLELKGGVSPLLDFVNQKCDLPSEEV